MTSAAALALFAAAFMGMLRLASGCLRIVQEREHWAECLVGSGEHCHSDGTPAIIASANRSHERLASSQGDVPCSAGAVIMALHLDQMLLTARSSSFAERWVGSARRECLDWMLVVSERARTLTPTITGVSPATRPSPNDLADPLGTRPEHHRHHAERHGRHAQVLGGTGYG